MKKFYFSVTIACFFLFPVISADAKDVLVDIDGLSVTIIHTGEEPNGIVWNELKNQINTRLIQAGIKVFLPKPGVMYELPLLPGLEIHVDMLRLEQSQQYVFHIQTSLVKNIYTEIEHPMNLYADVWKTKPVMKVVPAENIRTEITQTIMGQVDEFIYAHKAAVKTHPQAKSSDINDVNSVAAVKNPSQQPAAQTVAEYQYVASKNRPTFHKPDCRWAKKISPENLVDYKTREDAINAGKKPCQQCKP
jgi:micrococcal nuclease